MERQQFVDSMVDRSMRGLEIGPGYAPQFPRSQGWNVDTLDHLSADDLRLKYAGMTDVSKVENIDFVFAGCAIDSIIPERSVYDFVYASHVIEHLPDPIRFFQGCERVLKPNGHLLLAIPDMRRRFDAFQSTTSTGDFLDANLGQSDRHSPGRVYDFIDGTMSFAGAGIWESHWEGAPELAHPRSAAGDAYREILQSSSYRDIHAWRFTPSSLRKILVDLRELELTILGETSFIPTNRFEFFMALSRSGTKCDRTSLELRLDIAREQMESLHQILAA